MANLPLKFTGSTNDAIDGSWLQPVGKYQPQTVYFAGNFWARTSYGFDDPPKEIFPREGLKADADHPWIGNPDDDESMENARKVRWALSMAIDRESLTRNVFNGLGGSTYTYTDVMPDHERFNPEWKVEYDVEGAKKLLAEAGVPDGFEMDFLRHPYYFKHGTEDQGKPVMNQFIAAVRQKLDALGKTKGPVSYTHLTLPTSDLE